jgi:hypothetical protein
MRSLLTLLAAAPQPLTVADAADRQIDRRTVTRLAAAGALQRVDHGAYVLHTVWRDSTADERHLLRCRAVLRRYDATALSHTSAIVAHGLPTYQVDLDTVHLTRMRPGRSGGAARRRHVQLHPQLPPDTVTDVDGTPVCSPAAAVLQVADWHGLHAGMVAAEAALHRGLCSIEDVRRALRVVRLGRGRAHADHVVRLAGAASESPGETLTRLLLFGLGVETPMQQVPVALPGGGVARVDFLLPDLGVVVEFDGAVKYEGAAGREALVREKRREDGLRATGLEVVRLTWPDMQRPLHVAAVLDAAAQHHRRDATDTADRGARVPTATFGA